jgi:chromosome segregation ATPase
MSIFGILKTKFKKDLADTERDLIGYLAKVDFETVELHQLQEYEKALNEVSVQMARAKVFMDKEVQEYEDIKKRITTLLEDANKINAAITSPAITLEKKHKLESHLDRLLTEIETLKKDEITEKEEADDATEHFNLLKEAVEEAAKKLAGAKKTLNDKKRELEKTEVQQKRLQEKEDQQKVLYGIRQKTDAFGTVVGALDDEIQKKKQDIEASKARLDAMSKHSQRVESGETDPDIAEALGKTEPPKKSFSDRLAALQ